MKKLILFLLLPLSGLAQKGQLPFEGTIVYFIGEPGDSSRNEVTMLFSANKVRINPKFSDRFQAEGNSYILFDLDSGKIFTVNTDRKTFQVRNLEAVKPEVSLPDRKMISGYKTCLITKGHDYNNDDLAFLLLARTSCYVAEDLYFPVPEKSRQAPEMFFIQNQHIVLGATIHFGDITPMHNGKEGKKQSMDLNMEARSVIRQKLNRELFVFPQGYAEKQKENSYGNPDMDSGINRENHRPENAQDASGSTLQEQRQETDNSLKPAPASKKKSAPNETMRKPD